MPPSSPLQQQQQPALRVLYVECVARRPEALRHHRRAHEHGGQQDGSCCGNGQTLPSGGGAEAAVAACSAKHSCSSVHLKNGGKSMKTHLEGPSDCYGCSWTQRDEATTTWGGGALTALSR